MGGIQYAADAIEFMIAGATAVAVGTANFYEPQTPLQVIAGIRDFIAAPRHCGRARNRRFSAGRKVKIFFQRFESRTTKYGILITLSPLRPHTVPISKSPP